jgi:hypothetical protein
MFRKFLIIAWGIIFCWLILVILSVHLHFLSKIVKFLPPTNYTALAMLFVTILTVVYGLVFVYRKGMSRAR